MEVYVSEDSATCAQGLPVGSVYYVVGIQLGENAIVVSPHFRDSKKQSSNILPGCLFSLEADNLRERGKGKRYVAHKLRPPHRQTCMQP